MLDSPQTQEREPFDKQVMLALSSIVNNLGKKQTGILYLFTSSRFGKARYDGRAIGISGSDIRGQEFQHGIDKFVDSALQDPEVKGLIPLTERIRTFLIEKYNMRAIILGDAPSPDECYNVYWR